MKKITIILLLICSVLSLLSGCGKTVPQSPGTSVSFTVNNTVKDRISSLAVEWLIGGRAVSSQAVSNADSEGLLDCGAFGFELCEAALESGDDLSELSVAVTVTDSSSGCSMTVSSLLLPSRFGDSYEYELSYDGELYSLGEIRK